MARKIGLKKNQLPTKRWSERSTKDGKNKGHEKKEEKMAHDRRGLSVEEYAVSRTGCPPSHKNYSQSAAALPMKK